MTTKKTQKSLTINILIYLMITLFPSLFISHTLTKNRITELESSYVNRAQWYANFHGQHINNFIGETIARLDMLSKLIHTHQNDLNSVSEILTKTHAEDERFSGFYWANPNGDLLISTNSLLNPINVLDRDYFQQALATQNTAISEVHLGRVTGRFIITIATPVGQNGEVEGVLLASLRIDEIGESIKSVLNNEYISVTDGQGQVLIETGTNSAKGLIDYQVTIENVPWVTSAEISPTEDLTYGGNFLRYLAFSLIITHVLYILYKYFILKNKVKNQKQQHKLQKLELVGELAAGTAHEIRNPLTGIKGLIQLLSEKYTDKSDQLYFEVIEGEVDRINSIVSELLLIGKPVAHQLKVFDLNEIITEIAPIIQSEANYANVQFTIHSSQSALPISCVKDQLKQVVLNLSKNSIESMGTGGKLDIAIQKRLGSCIIQVKDTGAGMDEETLNQLFDPFFTMKEHGTGLGLTVCKRIIDNIGGTISIQSKLTQGTVVTIEIPLHQED